VAGNRQHSRHTTAPARAVQSLFAEAVRHHQAGRLAEAAKRCHEVLAIDSRHADSLHLLGVVAYCAGRNADAADLIRQAIALRDDAPFYHNNLANVLKDQGQIADALTHYQRALALKPDFAEASNNMGTALRRAGRLAEAAACYQRALAIRPDYVEACTNLGNLCKDQGNLADAIALYQRAIAIRPDSAAAHFNLGGALQAQGRPADALLEYQQALALKLNVADVHYNMAGALKALGRFDDAAEHYQRAAALQPDFADACHNLGNVLKIQGRFAEAEQAYANAIERSPANGLYYRHLVDMRRMTRDDRILAAIEALAEDMASRPAADQRELHFALGKAYADLGDHERAFRHYIDGNALRRREIAYDEAAMLAVFARIRAVFTHGLMQARQGHGDPSDKPIFIVGMPRSGTTLVEQILGSHPVVFAAGELETLPKAVAVVSAQNAAQPLFPDATPGLSDKHLYLLGASYLAAAGALPPGALRFVDKLPQNFLFLGLIHLALPNARIIHLRRDPVDTCLSCFRVLFEFGQPYSYDLGELGRYYRAYRELMAHWRQVLPPHAMLEVDYEDVVADLEQQARRILAYCNLPWSDACLAFHETQRPIRTASAMQVRQPIYRGSGWRPGADVLQPLLMALGGND